jgi:hypothetical protein
MNIKHIALFSLLLVAQATQATITVQELDELRNAHQKLSNEATGKIFHNALEEFEKDIFKKFPLLYDFLHKNPKTQQDALLQKCLTAMINPQAIAHPEGSTREIMNLELNRILTSNEYKSLAKDSLLYNLDCCNNPNDKKICDQVQKRGEEFVDRLYFFDSLIKAQNQL